MNKVTKAIAAIMLVGAVVAFTGCKKKEVIPVVETSQATNVTSNSATVGGVVTSDGGSSVVERGVCWAKNANPDVGDNHLTSGTGVGSFFCNVTGLEAATTYYFRAYAINNVGVSYGTQASFTTLTGSGGGGGNGGGGNPADLPVVATSEVTHITASSAQGGGDVVSNGASNVTDRGICWGTNHNPTVNNNHVSCGTGTGSFTAEMTGLTLGVTYYVRAYAVNSAGMAYGNEVSFTTVAQASVPVGALNGVFNVGERFVYFSKGNLQYQPSSNTWRFAENQYDCIGDANLYASSYYNGWLDMFGWGTSGYNHGAQCYQPWSMTMNSADYFAYGESANHLYSETGRADWGYNAISNGGNTTNIWRTLTKDEWEYVFKARYTPSNIRYAKAQVNGVNGMILLPDDWSASTYYLYSTNEGDVDYYVNVITDVDWRRMEDAGAVFLPAAGYRFTDYISDASYTGMYWTSSSYSTEDAYVLGFQSYGWSNSDVSSDWTYYRYSGNTVRLVQNVNR